MFDNYYGTGREPVEAQLGKGHDVVLEIDWQGAQQVRKALPECKTIFILPPSRRALEERLRNRATDSNEVIERRLRDAVGDMTPLAGVQLRRGERRFRARCERPDADRPW